MTVTVRGRKPMGRAGDWLAKWDGSYYACVHEKCREPNGSMHYLDPFDTPAPDATFQRYVAALRQQRKVIMTRTGTHKNGHPQRDKYVSVWSIADLKIGAQPNRPQSIEFDLVEREVDFVYRD